MKNFEIYVGVWNYEGENMENPIGPAGKFSGKQTMRWILNGFFLEWSWKEKGGAFVDTEGIEFDWYDVATKSYRYQGFSNDGTVGSGTERVNGNERIWESELINKGIKYEIRTLAKIAPDGMSYTFKGEISTDVKNMETVEPGQSDKSQTR